MSKKSIKEMQTLYDRFNDFFYDLQSLKRQLDYMLINVKGLCIEDRFSKYVSKMVDIMDECDYQRNMWGEKLYERRKKLEEQERDQNKEPEEKQDS